MPDFDLVSDVSLSHLFPNVGSVRHHRHRSTGMGVVMIPVEGPLTSIRILVPTLADSDHGLPHCLERMFTL